MGRHFVVNPQRPMAAQYVGRVAGSPSGLVGPEIPRTVAFFRKTLMS